MWDTINSVFKKYKIKDVILARITPKSIARGLSRHQEKVYYITIDSAKDELDNCRTSHIEQKIEKIMERVKNNYFDIYRDSIDIEFKWGNYKNNDSSSSVSDSVMQLSFIVTKSSNNSSSSHTSSNNSSSSSSHTSVSSSSPTVSKESDSSNEWKPDNEFLYGQPAKTEKDFIEKYDLENIIRNKITKKLIIEELYETGSAMCSEKRADFYLEIKLSVHPDELYFLDYPPSLFKRIFELYKEDFKKNVFGFSISYDATIRYPNGDKKNKIIIQFSLEALCWDTGD